MKVFMLDNSDETETSAPALAGRFSTEKAEAATFTDNCFNSLSTSQARSMVFLGHSDQHGIGDYNAKQFAAKFAKAFNANKGLKDKKGEVKHVYLVGCETALETSKNYGKSLAQQVADELSNQGFTNVRVHAVANPPDVKADAMRVRLLSKVPRNSPTMEQVGDMEAVLLTQKQEDDIAELQKIVDAYEPVKERLKDKAKKDQRSLPEIRGDKKIQEAAYAAQREINKIQQEATSFVKVSDVRAELDRPHNTFTPKQPDARPRKNMLQEEALKRIELQLRHLKNKSSEKYEVLQQLKNAIANNTNNKWPELIKAALDQKQFGSSNSTTKSILEDILKNANAKISKTDAAAPAPSKIPTAVKTNAATVTAKATTQANTPSTQAKAATPHSDNTPASTKASTKKQATIELKNFADQLERELDNRPNLFKGVGAKQYKADTLRELADAIGKARGDSWKALIKEALDDKRLTQSRITHRTKNLLTNIADDHPERGTNKPGSDKPPVKHNSKRWW